MKKTLATLAAAVFPAFAMAAGTTTPMAAGTTPTANASAAATVAQTYTPTFQAPKYEAPSYSLTGALSQSGTLTQAGTLSQSLTGSAVGGNLFIEGNKRNTPPAYASTPAPFNCSDTVGSGAVSTPFFGLSVNGGTTSDPCKFARDAHAVSVVFNTAGDGGNVGVSMLMNKSPDVRDGVEVAISMEECTATGKSRLVCAREAYQGFAATKRVQVAPASVSFGN